jgi:hypothetical protein
MNASRKLRKNSMRHGNLGNLPMVKPPPAETGMFTKIAGWFK